MRCRRVPLLSNRVNNFVSLCSISTDMIIQPFRLVKSKMLLRVVVFCTVLLQIASFSSFAKQSTSCTRNGQHLMAFAGDNEEGGFLPKRGQEKRMEMSSIEGAEAIAKLDIHERTKRAMLAEAVEDRIFELMDELEVVVKENDGVLQGESKEEAVELARQTKALQNQYDDLVNGRPSHLLNLGWDERGFQ